MSKPVTANDTASTTSGQADDTRVCPEIRQGGKLLIRINEPDRKHVFICPEIFRGNLYVNVREFFVLQFEQAGCSFIESKQSTSMLSS